MIDPNILSIFHKIVPYYDLMNQGMSLGLHHIWKTLFLSMCPIKNHTTLLDFGCGSGDMVRLIKERYPYYDLRIIAYDPVPSMIELAKRRNVFPNIIWTCEEKELLKYHFDGIICSFSLRNSDLSISYNFFKNALNKKGFLGILDFFKTDSYTFELSKVWIDLLGKWIGDATSYDYLLQSINDFITFEQLGTTLPFFLLKKQTLFPSYVQAGVFLN